MMSFFTWPLIGTPEFVGLDNYQHLFTWDPFYTSLRVTVIYGFVTTFVQLIIALGAALAVANVSRFKSIFSGIFMIPFAMPQVVTGAIWLYLLNVQFGPFWQYLESWGLIDQPIYWQTQGDAALGVIIGAASWTFWPFMFLLLVAAREGIPDEYYESAKVYGATRVQMFRYVTYPQIKSALLVAISLRIIWNFVKVAQPWQLTQGGPGYDTTILGILLYRFAFSRNNFGLAFAVGIILLAITLVFAILFIREFQKQADNGGGQAT
jgi:ABC-type sugar transport system permease subunit